FSRMAATESGQRAADMHAVAGEPLDEDAASRLSLSPIDNSKLRTTCVATRLNAGHANNALPQMAEANVNCRILPGHAREEIREKLVSVVNDPKVSVGYDDHGQILDRAPEAPPVTPVKLRPDVM